MISTNFKQYKPLISEFYQQAGINTLSNMMIPLAGLCDAAFLGHLQNLKYFAGVILGSILFDYLYRTLKFLRSSTTSLSAQALGKKDREEIILAFLRSSVIALIIALFILIAQYPIQRIGFAILSGAKDVEAAGVQYFNARIWGTPAVLLNFVLIGWFLGSGKSGRKWVLFLAVIANGSNVLLDYLMISKWGWGSMGAGLATSLSQYFALIVGFIGVLASIKKKDLIRAISKILNWQSLKSVLRLNNDIFVRFLALISAYSIFTNFSARISTESLAQNGLLIQIALLSQFTIQGTGLASQALIGQAKGESDTSKFKPLIILSLLTALPIALFFALTPQLFPQSIFGLFGDHQELNADITRYSFWLLPLLIFTALTFMFEAYFIALKQGFVLRNSSLISFFLAFLPLAVAARSINNIDLLWFSLCAYMIFNSLYLGIKLITQIRKSSLNNIDNLDSVEEIGGTLLKLPERKSKRDRNNRSFKWKNVFVSSLVISFFLISAYRLGQNRATQTAKENLIEIEAIATAQNLDSFLGSHYLQIQEMASIPFFDDSFWQNRDLEEKREYFQNNFLANSEGMDSFAIVDANTGNTILSGGSGTKTKNYNNIDYFQKALSEKKPVIVPYRKSTKTGIPYSYFAAPIFDSNNNINYIIRTRIKFEDIQRKINEDLNKFNTLTDSQLASLGFFLVDRIGRVIASGDENIEYLNKHINRFSSLTHSLRKQELTRVEIESIRNEDYFLAYSPIIETRGLPELNWSVILVAKS